MRITRLLGATLIVKLVLGLLFVVGATTVAAQEDCTLSVNPAAAQAGSEFVLTGSGYTPDVLSLQRGSSDPVTIELDLDDADPFEIPIGSRPGDEGVWTATVSVSGSDCEASAEFRVTLKNTDMIDDLVASPAGGGIPPIVYLAVILGGFGVGAFAARQLRLAV